MNCRMREREDTIRQKNGYPDTSIEYKNVSIKTISVFLKSNSAQFSTLENRLRCSFLSNPKGFFMSLKNFLRLKSLNLHMK